MFDPSGMVRMIPAEQATAAQQAGGKPAVKITDPQGTPRWIPADQQSAALQAGGKLADAAPTAPSDPNTPASHWYDTAVKELGDLNTGFTHGLSQTGATAEKALTNVPIVGKLLAQSPGFQKSQADDQARADESMDTGGKIAGNVIENILEFAGGDEALKGASLSTKLAKLAPLAKVMENSPRLARVLGEAIRQGAVGGAQAGAHGGGVGDVAEGAGAGAAGAVLFHGLPEGVAAMADRVKPGTAEIAGATVPTMSKTAAGVEAGLSPEIKAAQQAGAQEAVGNIAQRATQDSLDRVNATRPQPQPITDPARLLGDADAAPKPYQFNLDTPGSTDGNLAGGTVTTTDAAAAHAHLANLDSILESNSAGNLSGLKQRQLQAAADSVRSQIADEGAYRARMSHFDPIDSAGAASKVGNFADAAAQIEGGVSDVYSKLDQVSDGDWGRLRTQEQKAVQMSRNAATPEAADAADARLADIRQQMQKVFDSNRDQISPAEWRTANGAWKDAATLKDIHSTLERSYNGVDQDVADATGIDRTLKGGTKLNKSLQNLLNKRGDDVRRVIGQDGVNNLYRISDLLTNPKTGPQTKGLFQGVGALMRHHNIHLGPGGIIGGVAGGALSHVTGGAVNSLSGGLAGVAAESAIRRALASAAANPAIAERLAYAAQNNVSHRIAAPLLASMMLKPPPAQTDPTAAPQP